MKFFHIASQGDLIANSMGILEPNPIDEKGNPHKDGDVCSWYIYEFPLL